MAFALTPAGAFGGVIDYTTTEGRKLYYKASSKLNDDPFDCKPDGLFAFLESVHKRATDNAWNDELAQDDSAILIIPTDLDDPDSEPLNLINQYGELSMEHIRAYADEFVFQETRGSQNDYQLYSCLWESLTGDAKSKVLIHKSEFTLINDEEIRREVGVLLLKVIIRESHLDSNASASQIRIRLSSLDTYIVSINSDITKFNQYVLLMLGALKARGQTTQDLLVNLFKGYACASDKAFVKYITWRQERYEDGESLTPTALMNAANEKYKTLVEKKEWNAPSTEQQQILALEARLKKYEKSQQNKKGGKNLNGKGGAKKKGKDDKSPKPKALSKTPGPNDPTEIMWGNTKWHWCAPATGGKCNKWRTHEPSKCRTNSGEKRTGDDTSETPSNKKSKSWGSRGNKIVKALQQVVDTDSDDEVYEE